MTLIIVNKLEWITLSFDELWKNSEHYLKRGIVNVEESVLKRQQLGFPEGGIFEWFPCRSEHLSNVVTRSVCGMIKHEWIKSTPRKIAKGRNCVMKYHSILSTGRWIDKQIRLFRSTLKIASETRNTFRILFVSTIYRISSSWFDPVGVGRIMNALMFSS